MEPKLQGLLGRGYQKRRRRCDAGHALGQRLLWLFPKLHSRQHLQRTNPRCNGERQTRMEKPNSARQFSRHKTVANQKHSHPRKPVRTLSPPQNSHRGRTQGQAISQLPESEVFNALQLLTTIVHPRKVQFEKSILDIQFRREPT